MPGPNIDPRYVSLSTRLRAVRVDLDRLDDAVHLLDRQECVALAWHTMRMRGELDGFETKLHERAAGL